MQELATLPAALRALERELPRRAAELYKITEKDRESIQIATRWFTVADLEYELRQRLVDLAALQKRVDGHAKRANTALERVEAILNEAQRASAEAQSLGASSGVRVQLRRVVQESKLAQLDVQRSVGSILPLQAGLTEMTDEINQVLELSVTEGPSLSRDLTRMGPNAVQLLFELDRLSDLRVAVGNAYRHNLDTARRFLSESGSRVLGHALLGVGVFVALLWLRSREDQLQSRAEHREPSQLMHRPLAAAALLTMAATWVVYPARPASVLILAFCVVALMGLWFLPGLSKRIKIWQSRALYPMFIIEVVRILVGEMASLERLLLLAEGILGATLLALALRSTRRQDVLASLHGGKLWRWVLRFWLIAFMLGVLALGVGLVQTGTILISGATSSVFAAIIWASVHRILASAIQVLVANKSALQPNGAGSRGLLLARRVETALVAIFSFLWLRSTIKGLTLWDPTVEAVRELMELSAEAGALKLSVGGVVALLTGLVVAVYSARLVRSVLEEDIMPRTSLGAGTRAATSTSAYFGVMAVGIFLAIAATGVELGKLTVIIGALGVGIGFGLQNLVQNFVAGLILIFGRPVNVEDRIQIGELTGIVRRIGFRSSILRTFKGAEVIVPNADLINTQVINWTLSDLERRMEIDIGVAYGTDPRKVLELLLGVAHANPEVLSNPAPDALFLAHGASSLDFQLRAWTNNVGSWPNIQSDLTVAINRALQAAAIEIPFPQRDLHLRSVDPQALKALRNK